MHLPKTNLYIPSDSWDEEVKSWAITIRKVPVYASCSWTSSGPLKKHFMATKNLFSIMWASSATALHIAEPPVQQECHRQSGGRIIVQPSVSLALLKVSQILLLSSPFLPNQHNFANIEKSAHTSTFYTDPLELHCPTESALGTLPTNYCSQELLLWRELSVKCSV